MRFQPSDVFMPTAKAWRTRKVSTTPTCPRCGCDVATDFDHEADEYQVQCECGQPLVVFRHVSIVFFATTDVAKLRQQTAMFDD